MESKRRNSRQREKIYELIKGSQGHPSVQEISDLLKSEIKSPSIGNVYRNLRILIEQGRIKCRNFGDGVEHFDAVTQDHYHFVCERCGSITDFTMSAQESLMEEAQKISHHTITGHTIQFYGICEKCKNGTKY